MQKVIELVKKISKDLDKNWLPELEEYNLHKIFRPVYNLNVNISDANIIVSYIVFAYDNDSSWLNWKQERSDNKYKILKSLTNDSGKEIFTGILNNSNDVTNDVIADYLQEQTTWKWRTIFTLLDYHSNMIRFVSQKTEAEKSIDKINKEGEVKTLTVEYDIDLIGKVNKQKGELLKAALEARQEADRLLTEIRKEFLPMQQAVQQDFEFDITDEKKIDPMSWKDYIRQRNTKKVV